MDDEKHIEEYPGSLSAAEDLVKGSNMIDFGLRGINVAFLNFPKLGKLVYSDKAQQKLITKLAEVYAKLFSDEELRELQVFL